MKKLLAVMTAALLTLVLLAGCSNKAKSIHKLNVDGKEVSVPYVLKVGKYEIGLDEYRYYYLNIKNNLGMSDEDLMKNEDAQKQLKEYVETSIKNNYSMIALADDLNIKLTDEETKEVDESIKQKKESYESEEKYKEYLDTNFLTEDIEKEYAYLNKRIVKMRTDAFAEGGKLEANEENIKNTFGENYVRVKHVLIGTTTKDNQKVAKDVAAKAKKGDDFDKLIEKYGEDPGMKSNPLGYIMTNDGQMVKEFEDAAMALEVDKVSDPIKTTHGYHVIKRLPLDEAFIKENIDSLKETYTQAALNKALTEKMEGLEIKPHKDLEKINPETLK